jgi:predicted phosphodiesterase
LTLRALLYDVHGNLPALEAVIADAETAGAEHFVLGGDYALFGVQPKETIDRLRALDASWIRGNTDRWIDPGTVADDLPDVPLVQRSREYCIGQLGEQPARELAHLAAEAELDGALICHASPKSDMDTFSPGPSEQDDELLAGDDHELVVFGHSHLQFRREASGRLLLNPGSVGMPLDGDRRAAYALWSGGLELELRRVDYDADRYVAELEQRMGPTLGDAVETLTRRLRLAAFVS